MTAIGFVLFMVGSVFALLSNDAESKKVSVIQAAWLFVALLGLGFLLAASAVVLWRVAP